MADIHIDDFYKDTARILLQLYNAFPRKASVFVEDIAGPDQPDEFGLHSKRHMACFGAMLWLAEEGFIRYVDTIRQEAVDQAILTQQSFVRLSSLSRDPQLIAWASPPPDAPEAVKSNYLSHINLIREALRDGGSERITQTLHRILFPVDSPTTHIAT
ncbi:hypothetical protein [Mangrovitalea sediminis]|uniref:hypothetical protein n=1 Tax=Mangrovitalea sediminis TaxID=1982043 RepID=UPI000BE5F309|nr:hypothetical protein [Mangrovitalea sediminis]